jgi:hypothetical protein
MSVPGATSSLQEANKGNVAASNRLVKGFLDGSRISSLTQRERERESSWSNMCSQPSLLISSLPIKCLARVSLKLTDSKDASFGKESIQIGLGVAIV